MSMTVPPPICGRDVRMRGKFGERAELGAVFKCHGPPAAASPTPGGCASWRGAWRAE